MKKPRYCYLLLMSAGSVLAESTEPASRLVDSPLSAESLMTTGFSLVAVIALMLGLAWVFKRYVQVPGMGRGQIQMLGGISLGSREKALLISVEGRKVLLGVAPGRVQTLLVIDDADAGDLSFREQLSQVANDVSGKAPHATEQKR
jgi:flagellar protein FliO/FliZ